MRKTLRRWFSTRAARPIAVVGRVAGSKRPSQRHVPTNESERPSPRGFTLNVGWTGRSPKWTTGTATPTAVPASAPAIVSVGQCHPESTNSTATEEPTPALPLQGKNHRCYLHPFVTQSTHHHH